ncbi:MAG: bifunctional phosphopantothenoylcysteine decarboxylase/phosphopantothenate--cysteine ligase CoaBC [Bacillota bacterium]
MLDKKIVIGITGGIAAYKSAELVRLLVKEGCSVQAVMTTAAQSFVAPLTFSTLTGRPVYHNLFAGPIQSSTVHIDLARWPDLVVVAPATANLIGKAAHGLADDLLSTALLAIRLESCPVILAPAMNTAMLCNPAVQDNLALLRRRGFIIADPLAGDLACGEAGEGRMVEPEQLLALIKRTLAATGDYKGETVLVTAGPTREALDPVRFLSNHSSGRMGYALARAARERGARVILVSGPTSLEPPAGVEFYPVTTAREMFRAVMGFFPIVDIVIKTAAVADFRPELIAEQKIKKGEELQLKLVRNPDILEELGAHKDKQFLVGFAAETADLLTHARVKMERKNLDLIVVNDVTREGAGFETETNIVQLLYRAGGVEEFPLMSKLELSHRILDRIRACRKG